MVEPIEDCLRASEPCEISLWCANHEDAWVDMSLSDGGIKLKMMIDFEHAIEREITYVKIKFCKFDIISSTLDDMYKKLKIVRASTEVHK